MELSQALKMRIALLAGDIVEEAGQKANDALLTCWNTPRCESHLKELPEGTEICPACGEPTSWEFHQDWHEEVLNSAHRALGRAVAGILLDQGISKGWVNAAQAAIEDKMGWLEYELPTDWHRDEGMAVYEQGLKDGATGKRPR